VDDSTNIPPPFSQLPSMVSVPNGVAERRASGAALAPASDVTPSIVRSSHLLGCGRKASLDIMSDPIYCSEV
jgi:hypothetical protein